ncbi:DNA cytosine methyltransferase [Rhizobium laguerreae]|uniref:DNA cytosine methyltransferase n=1 Tax=Rhizobium laguerreae TaxID=1076926 RepID=UPI001C92791F|nr:DNA (cytosine-5-)-methyltransferase [Rhizobium laguerreae]MBY3378947.1 DNA cytosine methyltransferase [Rhizobium laguerreae]
MPDIDIKAQALSDARARILQLQAQMTDKVLQMAAEVEKLIEAVPASEAKAFLKARCNMPATELSTYVNFSKTLKGSEEVLQQARVSFPVVKSLVAADAETRMEILGRMELGAQIDAKDVAAIRRRLAAAKLTVAETIAAQNSKLVLVAARRQAKAAVAGFEERMAGFFADVRKLPADDRVVPADVRKRACVLLREFETLFGAEHAPLNGQKVGTLAHRIGCAYHALKDFRDDGFKTKRNFGLQPDDSTPTAVHALQAMTGRVRNIPGLGRLPKGLAELPPKRYHLSVLELCAGAGGMSIGLERAGFRSVGLIELNRQAAATLQKNRPDWPVVQADVRKVDFTQYRGKVDLIAGGVPCTPYSTIGERRGKDDHKDLFPEAIRAVKEAQPQAFIFENVEGLLHAAHTDHVAAVLREFSRAGYETVIERVNTSDYGLAQNRSRILFIGLRRDMSGGFRMPPKFPEMAIDMGTALADLMGENGWEGSDDWARRMRETPVFDKAGNLVRKGILADTIRGYKGSGKVGEKDRWLRNGTAYAPIAKAAPTMEEASVEGYLPRLTNRMRARLQGFPADWQFVGGIPAVANQIGNAVAPIVAQAVGLAMFSALRGMEFDLKAMLSVEYARRTIANPPSLVPFDDSLSDTRKIAEPVD